MRPARSVCLYFLLIFLGGALFAPWVYRLIHGLATTLPVLKPLAEKPFPQYLNRTLLLFGLTGLWPLVRSLGFRSWQDVGLKKSATWLKQSGQGFLLGFASLACVALLTLIMGVRSIVTEHPVFDVLRHLANAGSAAVIVSVLEEILFRGILFGGLRKTFTWTVALLASSTIYAGLHFIQRTRFTESIDWNAGFVVLGRMMRGFGNVEQLIPGFLTLTLAGVILGLAYHWTGSLYFSAGLHAGWIFWLKSYGFVTREATEASRWFWGTGKLIDGCLALVILSGVLAFLLGTKPQTDHRDCSRS